MNDRAKEWIALFLAVLIATMPVTFAVVIDASSIKAVSVTSTSAMIQWKTDVESDGLVEYGTNINSMIKVPETGGVRTNHEVLLSGLASGQKFYFLVKSSDGVAPASSSYYDFTTLLGKVYGLVSEQVTHNSVKIRWVSVSGATKYNIYKGGVLVANSTTPTATVSGLSPTTSYLFQVAAVDFLGREGDKSDALEVETTTKPLNISFVQASEVTQATAKITWRTDDPSDSMVYYGKTTTLGLIKSDETQTREHQIILDGLEENTRYYFKVASNGQESSRYDLKTLSGNEAIEITNVQATEVTKNSARITWLTNIPSNSEVRYSTDDTFNQRTGSDNITTSHDIQLTGLLSGTNYYYKVVSNGVEGAIKTFTTAETTSDFLSLDSQPNLTSVKIINVSGKTVPGSRVYIFVNDNKIAQVKEVVNTSAFSFPIMLDPSSYIQNIVGRNYVQVYSWDPSGNKDMKYFYITLDIGIPQIQVDKFPASTNKDRLNISGVTEPFSEIEFLLDSTSQGKTIVNETGRFERALLLGRDGNFTFTILATDKAGNIANYSKKIFVDRTAPQVEWLTDMRGKTHFKLFRIRGKTEPNAIVRVVNFGKYSGCDDPEIKSLYGGCDHFVSRTGSEPQNRLTGIFDPITYSIGMEQEVVAQEDGIFDVTVSLVPGEGNKAGTNNLYFNIIDSAGNENRNIHVSIVYEPGCADWSIGKIDTYPFNIYTRDLEGGDIVASAFFPIHYVGSGSPVVREVFVYKDDTNRGYLQSQISTAAGGKIPSQELSNRLVRIERPKATKYDEAGRQIYVYVPIRILRYTGSYKQLPNTLDVFMGAQITYTVDGNTASCSVYPSAQFDIQTPELITGWLSPTMLNNTIKALDHAINVTQKIVNTLRTASMAGLIACGAMIAYEYVSGFFQQEDTLQREAGEVCTEKERGMEKVYYVCDRILCPAVPPVCNNFQPITTSKDMKVEGKTVTEEEFNKAAEINQRWVAEYLKEKDAGYRGTFQDFLKDPKYNDRVDALGGGYQSISGGSTSYHTTIKSGDKSEYIRVDYYKGGDEKWFEQNAVGPLILMDNTPDKRWSSRMIVDLKSAAAKCKGGTLVVKSTLADSTDRQLNMFSIGQAVPQPSTEWECVPVPPDQLGPPNVQKLKGCYSADCPKYDNTKCPLPEPGSDIIPTQDLYGSIRCQCLPGMMGHINNYLKIMVGAKKCLEQAMIGEVRGGFCKLLLAQFVCDLLIQALRIVLNSISTGDGLDEGGAASTIRGNVKNYKTSQEQISKSLANRYGDIVKNKWGLSSDQLMNKACMFSVTGDWSLLDGLLDEFVEAVEIEPTSAIFAESRPYSFDPFTGRMNIGYNVYVGLVPGGENQIRVWLECDRSAPNGQFCGQTPTKLDVTLPRNSFRKNDPPLNENIGITDRNAKYWYNKVVMEITYSLAGKRRQKLLQAPIWKKGDIAVGCYFSPMNGIECQQPEFMLPSGIVQLYPIGKGSSKSPNVDVYFPGNVVNALIKIENRYQEDFYIRIDYPDGTAKEYRIPGAGKGAGYGREMLYNLWIDDVPATINTIATQGAGVLQYRPVSTNLVIADGKIKLRIANAKSGTLKITFDVGGKSEDRQVMINSQDTEIALSNSVVTLKKFELIDVKTDITPTISGSQINSPAPLTYITYKEYPSQNEKMAQIPFPLLTQGITTIGSRSVKIDVLQDTNGDGVGDTPILYDRGTPQTITLTYSIGATPNPNTLPVVEFIEPIGMYFNNDGNKVPLGFNVWYPSSLSNVMLQVAVTGQGSASGYRCGFTYKPNAGILNWEGVSQCAEFSEERSSKGALGTPPFFEFYMDTQSLPSNANDAIYDISVKAVIPGGEKRDTTYMEPTYTDTKELVSKEVIRRFKFNQATGDYILRQADVSVCLGGGECIGPFISPRITTVSIAKYNQSEIPSTRSG
ncbi:MAG: hypothetical protein QXK37_02075 [Candidatus Woesearchaeota archaeon]